MKAFFEKQAESLLAEHAKLKGPAQLEAWNIKAQTLLVFKVMNEICSVPSVAKEICNL